MTFTAKSAKVTAATHQSHWGGCFAENGLFVLLEVTQVEQKSALNLGKEILDALVSTYSQAKEINFSLIDSLLGSVKEKKPNINTLTIGILKDDSLYLGNLGDGEVLMKRGKKIGRILSSEASVSGKIMEKDVLLFSSKTFSHCLTQEERQHLLEMENEEVAAEVSSSILSKQTDNSSTAGASALILTIIKSASYSPRPLFSVLSDIKVTGWSKARLQWQRLRSIWQKEETDSIEDKEVAKSKRTLLTVAIILIILLTVSIFMNINHNSNSQKQVKIKEVLDLVSHQYDEAISLIDLNPVRARLLLSDSKISLAQLLKEYPKNSKEYKEINEWLGKIVEKEVAAYKIYKITKVAPFFDLTLIKKEGKGTKIASYQNNKAILDQDNKAVYFVSTDTKQAAVVAGADTVDDARLVTIHGKTIYLLTSSGIVGIDSVSKTSKLIIKTDEKWGEIVSLSAFGGNLYLLDKKNNAIWKYIATESGFSPRANYLNADVRADFSNVVEMIIDGSVWILYSDGTILKFTRGLGEPFSLKGSADSLADISAFATSDEDKNLYILDKATSRIVVFDKDGTYQSQYQWEDLANVADLVVSEEEKKIFVLSGNKIFAIDIK